MSELYLILPLSLDSLGFLDLSDSSSLLLISDLFPLLFDFLGDSLGCKYDLDSLCPLNILVLFKQLLKLDLLWHFFDDNAIGPEPPPGFTPVLTVGLVFERLLLFLSLLWSDSKVGDNRVLVLPELENLILLFGFGNQVTGDLVRDNQ